MVTFSKDQASTVIAGMRGGKGSVEKITLSEKAPECFNLYAKLVLQPGSSIGVHTHIGESELIYVVSGAATLTDEGETVALNAGDSTITFAGHSHGIENTGDEPLVLLACIVKD